MDTLLGEDTHAREETEEVAKRRKQNRDQVYWSQHVPGYDWITAIDKAAAREKMTRNEWVRQAIRNFLPKIVAKQLKDPHKSGRPVAKKQKRTQLRWNQYVPLKWREAVDEDREKKGLSRNEWTREAIRRELPKTVAARLSEMPPRGNPEWM